MFEELVQFVEDAEISGLEVICGQIDGDGDMILWFVGNSLPEHAIDTLGAITDTYGRMIGETHYWDRRGKPLDTIIQRRPSDFWATLPAP